MTNTHSSLTPVYSGSRLRDRYSGTAIQALLRLTPVRASGTAIRGLLRFASPGPLLRDRYSGTAIPRGLHWQLSDHQIPSVFLSRNMARAEASKAELALY